MDQHTGNRNKAVALLTVISALPVLYQFALVKDAQARGAVLICAAVSSASFFVSRYMIPIVMEYTCRKGLFGYDLNKRGTPEGDIKVAESLGLVTGVVFLMSAIFFQLLHFTVNKEGSDSWLVEYNAALVSICFMIMLGFVDDVLDIPWRYKLMLPMVATLPLLVAYTGHTTIVVPVFLRPYVGIELIELGLLYHAYMLHLCIFCTNSINILAGINGLEAGQTLVIAMSVLAHNLGMLNTANTTLRDAHLFSAFLMLPLIANVVALLLFNWYPSRVFVGDTFTYFAGMTFAVAGILGHFSETLLLFFFPQVINFVYSIPQLFKIVPCPRHRLPKLDPDTGLLRPTPNMNLVNLTLQILGPMKEQNLCWTLLIFQGICCAAGFALRHALSGTGVYKPS